MLFKKKQKEGQTPGGGKRIRTNEHLLAGGLWACRATAAAPWPSRQRLLMQKEQKETERTTAERGESSSEERGQARVGQG